MKNNSKKTNVDLGGMNYRDLPKKFKEELDKVCDVYPDSKITGRIQFTEYFGTRETYSAWLRVEDLVWGYIIIKYVVTHRGTPEHHESLEVMDIDMFDKDELDKL
jgi:hypothetical protein